MAEAPDAAGDDVLEEMLLQLQFNHEKLLKEKRAMEKYYEEVLSETEKKDETISTLKRRNSSLAAMARHLSKAHRASSDQLAAMQTQLDSAVSPAKTAPGSSETVPEEEDDVMQEARDALAAIDQQRNVLSYTDALDAANELVARLEQQVADQTLELKERDARMRELHDNIDEYKLQIAELNRELRRARFARLHDEDPGQAASGNTSEPAATQAPAAAPARNEAPADPDLLQEFTAMQDALEKSEAATALLQHEVMSRDKTIIEIRDQMDEAAEQLAALQKELNRAKKELKQARKKGFEFEEDFDLGDESVSLKQQQGLTKDETSRILHENIDLKLKMDVVEDEVRTIKALYGKLQWDHEQAKSYHRARTQLLIDVLRKPASKKIRAKLLAVLEQTKDEE
eukprot:m.40216 g.40216  ORF g.40216 m.40216 type:complete len:400 (+) comp5989_c1_seq1:120-1319(+)